MKDKRLRGIFFVIILCFALGIGCSKVGFRTAETERAVHDFPKEYIKTTNAIEFKTKINTLSEQTEKVLKRGKATPKKINIDSLDERYYVHETYFDFSAKTKEAEEIEKFLMTHLTMDCFEEFKTKKGDEVLNIQNRLQEIGVSNIEVQKADKLEAVEEGYVLTGKQTFQGNSVIDSTYFKQMADAGAPLRILYMDDTVERLQILYNYEFCAMEEDIRLLPFEEIAKALEQHYDLLLTSNQYVATEAELCFMVEKNFEKTEYDMLPVWIFTIQEHNKDGKVEFYEAIHAETAQLVEVGS